MPFRKFFRFLPALVCMVTIFWLSSIPSETIMRGAAPLLKQAPKLVSPPIGKTQVQISWLKVGHFVGYAALGAALLYGFGSAARQPGLRALAIATAYAISDELHQAFVPGRGAGWEDVVLDVSAAGVAILILLIARQVIKKRGLPGSTHGQP